MSVLTNETAVNPDKNLWVSSLNDPTSIVGTTTGTTSSLLVSNTDIILNTITLNRGAGTYVLIGSYQWSTNAATAIVLRGYLRDTVSGNLAEATTTSSSASSYSASCVLTFTATGSVTLQQFVNVNVNSIATCRAQWSVLFFPTFV